VERRISFMGDEIVINPQAFLDALSKIDGALASLIDKQAYVSLQVEEIYNELHKGAKDGSKQD
jgi:hypothetical protein